MQKCSLIINFRKSESSVFETSNNGGEASDECVSSYIGATTRRLKERICEHLGVSFLPGNKLSDPKSAILDHSRNTGHPILKDSFKIIGGCRADDSIFILESVFIKYHRPNLNNMESSYSLQIT